MPDERSWEIIDGYDVVVIGCGIAGICGAIRSAELGHTTAVLEIAPKEKRGGQTSYAGLMRVPSTDCDLSRYGYEFDEKYSQSDFRRDIMKVTQMRADPDLTDTLVKNAGQTIEWITSHGVEWGSVGVPAEHWQGTVVEHRQGLGKHTMNYLVQAAEDLGVEIYYRTKAKGLLQDNELRIAGVEAVQDDRKARFEAQAVIIASGGFESNVEKRSQYLGKDYDIIKVRGTRYNTGEPIEQALEIDAQPAGHWSGAHVTIIDGGSPDIEGGENKVYGYPYGIVVNHNGQRFLDEGEDMQTFTYAKYGRKVFEQPHQEAFVLFDESLKDHVYSTGPTEAIKGETIRELANRLGIGNVDATEKTVEEFNAACDPGEFVPNRLDGNATTEITPKKTNWAIPVDEPPFYGYPATAGITFTFGGLKINTNAQVIHTNEEPIPGLYAAGSSTGGIFYHNYPSGSEQANAAVYAKLAAEHIEDYLAS